MRLAGYREEKGAKGVQIPKKQYKAKRHVLLNRLHTDAVVTGGVVPYTQDVVVDSLSLTPILMDSNPAPYRGSRNPSAI